MIRRILQSFWLLTAACVGYWLGSGPFADWTTDVCNMAKLNWTLARATRGTNGILPLLIAGFLIGQGIFLLVRRFIDGIGLQRANRIERLAAWDPSLQIPRRFGLHRYVEHCAQWAAEDPSARTSSLALFKIHGLGALNEEMGTAIATRLLQRISIEVRLATLTDSASSFAHWKVRFLPRLLMPSGHGKPVPRYPARWSGSTFALAFRELDAAQAIAVARDLSAWIQAELRAVKSSVKLSLAAGIAVGAANVTARGLAAAAQESTKHGSSLLTVVYDESDLREPAILLLNNVAHKKVQMAREDVDRHATETISPNFLARITFWLRAWGPALGCILAAIALLQLTGSKTAVASTRFTWPENLQEVQVVDGAGSMRIRLRRTALTTESAGGWTLSEGRVVQGELADGPLSSCQIHITVTNNTDHIYYISGYDFTPVDAKGQKYAIDPARMLFMPNGLAGRWMGPGESWSAWLVFPRREVRITGLQFEPDRLTRIVLRSTD